jgi:hypothetical protein
MKVALNTKKSINQSINIVKKVYKIKKRLLKVHENVFLFFRKIKMMMR